MRKTLEALLGGKAAAPTATVVEPSPGCLQLNLKNHLVLVTGATGQLGRIIARTLADCGADVVIHYHKQRDMAARLQQDLETRGARAVSVQADVTSSEDVVRMRDEIARSLGDPDIVVANAVVQYKWTTVLDQAVADYESQFRSCILQNVILAKQFAPAMMAKKWGRFIAISTECAMQNQSGQSAYVSGKRGMDGLLRVLAREIGEHQITVNQVAPGWMISEAVRAASTERQAAYEKLIPLRRRGEDQDVANLVAFLASDLAKYISGAYISVSGGNVMPAI
jgi:3-oxoacyl-[acyl-carrier protein] reductase